MKNRYSEYVSAAARAGRDGSIGVADAGELRSGMQEMGRESLKRVEALITAHPAAAIATAAGLGIVLGWWVKRR